MLTLYSKLNKSLQSIDYTPNYLLAHAALQQVTCFNANANGSLQGICVQHPGGQKCLSATGLHRREEVDFLKQISTNCCHVQPLSANRIIRPRSMTKPSICGGGGGGGARASARGGGARGKGATQENRKRLCLCFQDPFRTEKIDM